MNVGAAALFLPALILAGCSGGSGGTGEKASFTDGMFLEYGGAGGQEGDGLRFTFARKKPPPPLR